MLSHHYDRSRAIAVASQATGLIAIVVLETWLGDAARPWQGLVFALMLAFGLGLALRSYYLKQRPAATESALDASGPQGE